MAKIKNVIGREIIDSRGNPTVEAEVHLDNGCVGCASVPSGASTGLREAIELRDKNSSRFFGKGVSKAVYMINHYISQVLINKNIEDQFAIDNIMINLDGTENKSFLGANSILAVSLSAAKAAASYKGIRLFEHIAYLNGTPEVFSLPLPMINIINGGKHADNNIDIQEFMIQPISAKTIKEAIRMSSEVFHSLSKVLKKKKMNINVGDEGGYAPNFISTEEVLSVIEEAIRNSGYILGLDFTLALDCAASEFFDENTGNYNLKGEEKIFSSKEFTYYLTNLINKYPITSIEDGQSELDWNGFQYQTKILGNYIQLVGDDLFVTNTKLLKKGIEQKVANSILIKLNQIGSLTETMSAINMAKNAGYSTIISHRSGETEDVTIADLAVGTCAGQIKTGSVCRSDRVAKYNQLIRIEEILNSNIFY